MPCIRGDTAKVPLTEGGSDLANYENAATLLQVQEHQLDSECLHRSFLQHAHLS